MGLFKEDGSIEILEDADGSKTVPSVIMFKSRHQTVVGAAALPQEAEQLGKTLVYDVKRLIGK